VKPEYRSLVGRRNVIQSLRHFPIRRLKLGCLHVENAYSDQGLCGARSAFDYGEARVVGVFYLNKVRSGRRRAEAIALGNA